MVKDSELEAVPPAESLLLQVGARVRMSYRKKYYYGTIIDSESDDDQISNASSYSCDSDDDVLLSNFKDTDDDVPLSNFKDSDDDKPLQKLQKITTQM